MAPCQTVWSLKMALMVIICSLVAVYIAAGVEGMKPFVWGAFLLDSEKPTRNLEPLEYNIELEIAKERNAFKGTVDIFVKFLSTRNLFGRMAVGLAEILPSDESSGPTPERRVAFRLAEGLEVTEFKIKTAASIKELHEGHGELLHDGSTIKQCAIRSDAYAIDLNRNMPVGHYGKISFAYKTRSNDKIFLGSIYDPVAKHKNLYEAIRLEHFQARHLIPCFDEPNFKPKIRLRVKHPFEDQSSVIANMPVEREYEITLEQQSSPSFSAMHSQSDTSVGPADEETIEDETDGGSLVVRANGPPQEEKETGRVEKLKVVEFQPSVPMPISSLVFAIGPYQRIYDSHLDQSSNLVKVNFFAPNGHGLDECTIALEFAIKAVAWFQQHFESNEATAHPLKRINLVAVPSNDKWTISDGLGIGLIDHQFLLIDERLSSPGYEIEMALSVAQVVARQWFGHLMVPKSVEDSWITEGLAFHTAVRMVHSIKPEYKIHQYVKARYYRQAMFKKRTKSSIVNKLRGKSVLDLLQANVVRNDRVFNGIIGKLIKQTTRAGIVQSDMAAAFVIDGFSREQIDRIIDVQREFYLGDSLRVNLDSSGLIRISHQLETNVRWPVEMRLRFSNFDGTRTESIEVPVSEFEQGKHKIELKPPEWFTSENEEAWFVVELGKGQILPYHQLHYSSNIISRLRKPFETRLLKPAECVAILGQQANTIHMRTDGSYEMSNQIKMIGWFMEEKDPDVLLEVLDVIKWLSECRQYIRDPPYEFNKELKMIHNNLNGFTWIGNESLSEQRAKSAVALRLICFIRDREIISDAANYYLKNKDNIPAFYRGPVFLAVDKNDILDGAIKEELHARLLEASLAEDRSRGIFGCWSRVNEYY